MCTFYILFYGRPEIVSKFRPFYHDMDFRVKAAHSVSCTHNIIFRNRCAEYTCITKLLLHTFSHIKHTAFFLVCYILSPDKRIGVMTEFSFQRFVNGVHHKSFLSFCLMDTFFILLRLIRFGYHKVIDTLGIRIGSRQGLSISG